MKKVKLVVFGLLPTLMFFLVSCSVQQNVRAIGKEQHTGVIYILELTKDSMVFKGEDGTIYEAEITKDRNILNHAYGWSGAMWGTLYYLETPSGWKVLRFTPDQTREQHYTAWTCGQGVIYYSSDGGIVKEKRAPKKSKKNKQ